MQIKELILYHKKVLLGLVVLIIAIIAIVNQPTKPKEKAAKDEKAVVKKEQESYKPQRRTGIEYTRVVERSQSPKAASKEPFTLTEKEKSLHASMEYVDEHCYGYTPELGTKELAESKQLSSVHEALHNPVENGSRISAAIAPKAFDKERYLTDAEYKQEYIRNVEPGRAFLTDPDSTEKLTRLSPYLQTVEQGSTIEISVQGVPGSPISITSFDLGKFDNHLTYQTIEADSSGTATFTFHGMEGTIEDSNILVASPMSKNKLKFIINTQISQEKSTRQ